MIVEVDEVGYADAVAAFGAGNRAAASVLTTLLGGLAGTGRMAGDDAGAAGFAAAYDAAAGEAVTALAEVATAFATLGRVTERCDARHRESELGLVTPGAVVDAGCSGVPDGAWLAPLPARPPSALGGDPPVLSPQEAWVLDHVEGFVWPDADVTRLRIAAGHWQRAADALDGLGVSCARAADALLTQRSPEVPLAVAAADDLRATVRSLAGDCGALSAQCTAYADAVEAAHAAIRALLREVLAMVVEGLVVAAVLGAITAGVGAAGGSAAVALRVSAAAPRFWALLSALRGVAAGAATSLRATHTALLARRARLARYLRVPAVRGERGAVGPLLPGRRARGWLAKHEHSGSHTIGKHVGKSTDQLRGRSPMPSHASSFATQREAEEILERALAEHQRDIDDWLAQGARQLVVEGHYPFPTGISVARNGPAETVHGVRVVLRRDATMPEGYRIHTAFPQP